MSDLSDAHLWPRDESPDPPVYCEVDPELERIFKFKYPEEHARWEWWLDNVVYEATARHWYEYNIKIVSYCDGELLVTRELVERDATLSSHLVQFEERFPTYEPPCWPHL